MTLTTPTRDLSSTTSLPPRPSMVQRILPASGESTARTGVVSWIYRASRSGAVLEGVRGDGSVAARFDLVRIGASKFAIDGRLYGADGSVKNYNVPLAQGDVPPPTFAPDAAFTPLHDALASDALAISRTISPGGIGTIDPIDSSGTLTLGAGGGGISGGLGAPTRQSECDKATADAAVAAAAAIAASFGLAAACIVTGPGCTAAFAAYGAALFAFQVAYERELAVCL